MKYILLALALLLAACDKPAAPQIAAPQRAVLDNAKAVDQMVQQNTAETKQKVDDAEK
jgi:lipopolysaccharide export LptBFGC system permease protein LptF